MEKNQSYFFVSLNHFSGMSAGMYVTSSPEACHFVCESSRANIVVVEDDRQLKKIIQIREKLPELKSIVQYHGVPRQKGVLSVSLFFGTFSSKNCITGNFRSGGNYAR